MAAHPVEGSCVCSRENVPQLTLCHPPQTTLSGEHLSLAPTKMVSLGKQTEEATLFSQNQQCPSR